ncbi:MAG: hypothetical protein WC499_04970 [Patescibacteria group bacterium]
MIRDKELAIDKPVVAKVKWSKFDTLIASVIIIMLEVAIVGGWLLYGGGLAWIFSMDLAHRIIFNGVLIAMAIIVLKINKKGKEVK